MFLTNEDLKAISKLLDEKLDEKLDKRLNPINGRLDSMEGRLDKLESRLDSMEGRLTKLEEDVASLKTGQMEIRKELYRLDRRIEDAYRTALDAWGEGVENRTLIMNMMNCKTIA